MWRSSGSRRERVTRMIMSYGMKTVSFPGRADRSVKTAAAIHRGARVSMWHR